MASQEFFGLDIGNHTIKSCQIKWEGTKPRLEAVGSCSTPLGVIGSESVDHQKELAEYVKKSRKDAGISTSNVVVGLPESKIFTQLVTIPKVEDSKLDELIHWEAKKYVPIPIDEVRVDWIFLGDRVVNNQPSADIFLIAAPVNLINRYLNVMKLAGLQTVGIETEAVATTRALWWQSQHEIASSAVVDRTPVLLLDLGAKSTDLSVVIGGTLLFSQSLITGSDALTEAVAADYGLEMQQAEEYKRTYGLDETQLEGKIAKSLKPIMNVIVSEANKTLDFFKSRFPKSVPRRLLLVGEGAKLPGIMNYMATEIGTETSIADPMASIEIPGNLKSKVDQISTVGYSVAIGLALKNS